MGDFPTHSCMVTYDGDELPVTSPMSLLDCKRPRCRQRAELARRGTAYSIETIRVRLADAEDKLRDRLDDVDMWRLVLEAKERLTNQT